MFPTVKYPPPISTSALSLSPLQTSKPFNPYSTKGHLSPLTQDQTQFSVGLTPTRYLLGVSEADPLRFIARHTLSDSEAKSLKESAKNVPGIGVHIYRDKVYAYRHDVLQPLLQECSGYFYHRVRYMMKKPSRYIEAVYLSHRAGVGGYPLKRLFNKEQTVRFRRGYEDALDFKNKDHQQRIQMIREAMNTYERYDTRQLAMAGVMT